MSRRSHHGAKTSPADVYCLVYLNLPRRHDWRVVKEDCIRNGWKIKGKVWTGEVAHRNVAMVDLCSHQDALHMFDHWRSHPIDGIAAELCLFRILEGRAFIEKYVSYLEATQLQSVWHVCRRDLDGRINGSHSINGEGSTTISPVSPPQPMMAGPSYPPPTLSARTAQHSPNYSPPYDVHHSRMVTGVPVPAGKHLLQPHGSSVINTNAHTAFEQVTPYYLTERRTVIITELDEKFSRRDLITKIQAAGRIRRWDYQSRHRRSALIEYESADTAARALRVLDGVKLGSRRIKARIAKEGSPIDMRSELKGCQSGIAPNTARLRSISDGQESSTLTGTDSSTTDATHILGRDTLRRKTPAIANGTSRKH
ncbi:hypothetical protein CAC42_1253 [Sphaceloma murrayae]|uniref:RRM domain-containing protein n=1 Tax=Sphaceloma murrayae TaxID=2082308 RepID=A0A2K1R2F4_9PEZI|nr:hypothetical protein CAC42_1253 [Sphaceloma murrayae]